MLDRAVILRKKAGRRRLISLCALMTQSWLLLRRLDRLTRDNSVQQRQLVAFHAALAAYVGTIDRLVGLQAEGRHAEAVAAVRAREGRTQIADFVAALRRVDTEKRGLPAERPALSTIANANADRYNYIMSAAALIVVLLMAYAGFGAALGHRRAVALTEKVQLMATADALTGLANRRRLMGGMALEVARAERSRPPARFRFARHRSLQVDQRHARPSNGRRGAAGGGRRARQGHPRRRLSAASAARSFAS